LSLYCAVGGPDRELTPSELEQLLAAALDRLGPRQHVMAVPPDMTRFYSQAGFLTQCAWRYYGDRLTSVLPALGTHTPMRPDQLVQMFGPIPQDRFLVHNWRTDPVTLGEVPADFIERVSEGKLHYAWPAQVNRQIVEDRYDLVLSIGQVVPHEVIGMANYNKNILVGTGGRDGINRSHYLGAVYGMERIMGKAQNPVRAVLNYAADRFLRQIPIVYVHTVVGRTIPQDAVILSKSGRSTPQDAVILSESGRSTPQDAVILSESEGRVEGPASSLAVRGLFIGDDEECFLRAAELSVKVNFEILSEPIRKAVVYLDPHEYHSTWIGNKAVYRTRMALADGAELIILAPGVSEFGEDKRIDELIRKYGYRGTPATIRAVEQNQDLAEELGAAAHLIHASSEGRFQITWCPGKLTREEIEGVNLGYADLAAMMRKYDPAKLQHGYNTVDSEDIFFIANPALGLWSHRSRL
jgi:nickel-dependent lactate racemase